MSYQRLKKIESLIDSINEISISNMNFISSPMDLLNMHKSALRYAKDNNRMFKDGDIESVRSIHVFCEIKKEVLWMDIKSKQKRTVNYFFAILYMDERCYSYQQMQDVINRLNLN